jgi:hypothetical protein
MRIGIELCGNKGSKTFIALSFRACNSAEIGSTPLDFVDSEIYLRSRKCLVPIMFFQMGNNFGSENTSSVKNLIT